REVLADDALQAERAYTAAVLKRRRVQPRFPNQLAGDAQQLGPATVADKDGGTGVPFQVLLEVSRPVRLDRPLVVPELDPTPSRTSKWLDEPGTGVGVSWGLLADRRVRD